MREDKEFEKWLKSMNDKDEGTKLLELCSQGEWDHYLPDYRDIEKIQQEAYEAGQRSERNKHRWILVTERLPTEKDGKKYTEHGDSMVDVVVCDCNAEIYTCSYNLRKNDWECGYDGHVKWQPLPEE